MAIKEGEVHEMVVTDRDGKVQVADTGLFLEYHREGDKGVIGSVHFRLNGQTRGSTKSGRSVLLAGGNYVMALPGLPGYWARIEIGKRKEQTSAPREPRRMPSFEPPSFE